MKLITRPDKTALVTFRIVFGTGAAADPPGKGGAAWLTAEMIAEGGSRALSRKQILDAFFPMGVTVAAQVDKEMIAFCADVHVDHLERFYTIFREMLLSPGWRDDDFARLRDDAVNHIEVELCGQNDEELGKEALSRQIYRGHAYERYNAGSVSSLEALTLADLKEFYLAQFARDRLTVALGGGYPVGFDEVVRRDFAALPLRGKTKRGVPRPRGPRENELLLIEKPARGVAVSIGFPIDIRRGHADYPALLLACSALGQHRMSSGRLFTRMRQVRGLNYGDYAYIEHFPGAMFTLEQGSNLARTCQAFELWIRPVEPAQAHFALRLALHELEKLVRFGLGAEEFERTRSFLRKYAPLLVRTKSDELGYLIDSDFYGIAAYLENVRAGLGTLTLELVNAAIRRHLRYEKLSIVMVGEGMEQLRRKILAGEPSPHHVQLADRRGRPRRRPRRGAARAEPAAGAGPVGPCRRDVRVAPGAACQSASGALW